MPEEHPKIMIVDESDAVVGAAPFWAAVDDELIRRIVRTFVFNSEGQFLVQKRAQMKMLPGLLDSGAAGHVDEGESYLEAVARELQEEIGVEIATSEFHEFAHYYSDEGRVAGTDGKPRAYRAWAKCYYVFSEGSFTLQPNEVASLTWHEYDDVVKDTKQRPEEYMSGMIDALQRFEKTYPGGITEIIDKK